MFKDSLHTNESLKIKTARETFAAVRAQRAWRRFASERTLSRHLAARFLATRPAPGPEAAGPEKNDASAFDAFADAARDEGVLNAARLFFARVAEKLNAADRDIPRRTARCDGETASESATFASILSTRCEPPEARGEAPYAFPAREALCAYAVASFPEVVLGAAGAAEARGDHARALKESARETARAADALARALAGEEEASSPETTRATIDSSDASLKTVPIRHSPRVLLRRFAEEWRAYARAFQRWKARDAAALERELTRAAVEMETSARRACGANARAEDFPEGSDARSILVALADDARVLRGKVRGLAGQEGVERFDRARRAARARVARDEAADAADAADSAAVPGRETAAESPGTTRAARRVEAREAARASRLAAYAARRAASDAATEISSESSSRVRTSAEAYENEAIMHELLVDPEWRLPANENAFSANAAPGVDAVDADALGARVREAMTRAFWDATRDALLEKDVRRAAGVVAELGDALASLCPEHRRSEAEAALLLRLTPTAAAAALARVADDPSALGDAFAEVTREASRMLARLGAPARDARAARDAEALERRVGALAAEASALSSGGDTLGALRVAADAVAHALRELFAALACVRRDVANVAVASLAPLARRDERGVAEGSAWAWDRFAARRGVAEAVAEAAAGGGDAARLAAALPRTSAWLAAATSAAHALDASIPSLAFETRDPPNATSATSAGATNPRRFAFAMRSGNAFGSARGEDARSGAFRIASSSPRDPAQVSVRATRATSHEGLVRVALVNLVTSNDIDESVEAPDGGGSAETPETLEFDAARLRDARRAFDALRVRAACLFVAAGAPCDARRPARGGHAERLARLDALLADPTTSADDLALEAVGGDGDARKVAAAAATLRRLLAPRDPSGARLTRALAEALCVRALLGPPVAAASPVAAARAAAGAAPLLRAGFRGPDGAAVARDVASLAASLDVSVGRVTWGVHARAYAILADHALAARDEI